MGHVRAVAAPKRHLHLVPPIGPTAGVGAPASTVDRARTPPVRRAVGLGGAVALVCVALVAFVVGVVSGMQPGDAFELAALAGVWGGIGFGAVVGSVVVAATQRTERRGQHDRASIRQALSRHA